MLSLWYKDYLISETRFFDKKNLDFKEPSGEKNFSKTKQVTATSSAIFGVKEFSD